MNAATRLDDAQQHREAIPQLDEAVSLADAYRIQHEVLARRHARGERPVGAKLGFTSRAKMVQMGVSEIIVGQLTDAMLVPDGGSARLGDYIHPRIEPEVAFRLGADVDPDDPRADVVSAIVAVAPAMEIIDSRYKDFSFNLADVVADNTSAAGFVIGAWQSFETAGDLGNRAVRMAVDGAERLAGSTAAILGHPLTAMVALLGLARRYAIPLRAGDIVLAGAATEAIPFAPGHYETRVNALGSVSVRGLDG